jgi:hypothetical protein
MRIMMKILVKKLTPTQRAYIAGIVDGEGTITLTVKQRGANAHAAISIVSTEKNLIWYLFEIIGTGKITTKKAYKINHAPSYTYAVYNQQALFLLKMIYPYLKTYKAKRASFLLRNYNTYTLRNGKYTPRQSLDRAQFVKKFFAIVPHTKKAIAQIR